MLALLYLLPALVLMVLMSLRRYPGERRLIALVTRRRRPRPTLRVRLLRRRGLVLTPRGGLLLGCFLAVRPPPTSAIATG